ncbi:MAG TPA: serine/threonine-protein kinase, partial [Kofleriaceae bacterium]|nr:serine/threonine-protein kinase [Kofleriaceae bacterium]
MLSDATEADPRDATEIGTQAESPRALAEIASGSRATELAGVPRSRGVSTSGRPVPTAAAALDRSDLTRMRAFHIFGVLAPIGAILLSTLLGGDPTVRFAFRIGAGILSACNVVLVFLTTSEARYRPLPVGLMWIMSTLGVLPAVAYFGPFSAVVMVLMLGVVFIALGRVRWTALATAGICIGGHAAIALPIVFGWVPDRGVLSSRFSEQSQLWAAEVLIIGFLTSGYALGRWARSTSAAALAELQQAMQVIGDKEQALAEVVDQARRANRANEGRWTNQTMGSFRLGLVLGRGAMGEVYEAVRGDGLPAAVKLLNARSTSSTTLVERFHREMEVAARLDSPNIVRVFELSRPDAPVPYLAMERLHGTDLATRLRAENRMPSDELVVLLDQVARGLEVARLAGVVHRDLKPHNLFCCDDGTWKVLDFGVALLGETSGTLTRGAAIGTPQYMAPEQARGEPVDHRADLYALGAVIYRCLTGRLPFVAGDTPALLYAVVHIMPVRPSALAPVSAQLEAFLQIALAKPREARFESGAELALAFAAAEQHALPDLLIRRARRLAQQLP